jgi:hypothetical protein
MKDKNAMYIASHLVNECNAFVDYCAEHFGEEHNEAYRCAMGIMAKLDSQNHPERYKEYSMNSMFEVHLCAGRIIEHEDIVAICQLEDEVIASLGK